MRGAMGVLELLEGLGGAKVVLRRDGVSLAAALVKTVVGRQLILVERIYRGGTCVLLDPTEDETETAATGDLWQLWNSERAVAVWGLLGPPEDGWGGW